MVVLGAHTRSDSPEFALGAVLAIIVLSVECDRCDKANLHCYHRSVTVSVLLLDREVVRYRGPVVCPYPAWDGRKSVGIATTPQRVLTFAVLRAMQITTIG